MFQKLIRNFEKINSIKINKKSINKVLIVDRGRFYQAHLSVTLAKALSEKYNYEPEVLLNSKKDYNLQSFYKSYGVKNVYIMDPLKKYFFVFPALFIFFYSIIKINFKGIDWFINNFSVNRILIGHLIWDFYIRKDLSFLKRNINWRLSKIIFLTIFRIKYLENYLQNRKFKSIIVNSNSYVSNSSILLRLGLKYKINVYYQTVSDLHKLVSKNQININTLDINKKNLKKLYNSEKNKKKIYNFLNKRFKGKSNNSNILDDNLLVSAYKGKSINSIIDLKKHFKYKKIKLSKFKNIFLFAPHCFSDSNHAFGNLIFSDYYDQFIKTLEFIKKDPNNFWIIKSHPHSRFYGEEKLLKNLLKKNKLKNIFFINSNSKISTKCLLEYSDLVITSGGTIGLESACLGKKSLITNKTYYSNFGLTFNPKSQKEYFKFLINFKKQKKLDRYSILLARKLLYWGTIGRGFNVYSPINNKVKNQPLKLINDFIKNKSKFNKKNLDYIKIIEKNL